MLEESLSYYNKLKKLSKSSFKFHHISTDEVFGSLGKKGSFAEDSPYPEKKVMYDAVYEENLNEMGKYQNHYK